MHSIRSVSDITGIKADTIRSWERRYGVLSPKRDANGRRLYDDCDIERLNEIAMLVNAGYAIGRLAELDDCGFKQLAERSKEASQRRAAQDERIWSAEQQLRDELTQVARAGDLKRFHYLVRSALALYPPHIAIENLIAPTLRVIGEFWERKELGSGLEHALSAIIKEHLLTSVGTYRWAARGPAMTFSTLSGEQHEIGALMACYIAAAESFQCHYLGPNLPESELVETTSVLEAAVLALSIVHPLDLTAQFEKVRRIAEAMPPGHEIWVGVSRHLPEVEFDFPANVEIFDSVLPFRERLGGVRDARR